MKKIKQSVIEALNPYFLSSLISAVFTFAVIVIYSHFTTSEEYVRVAIFSGALGMMPSLIAYTYGNRSPELSEFTSFPGEKENEHVC